MTDAGWAEKKARNGVQYISCITDNEVYSPIAKLLKAEYARSVRIVKAEIKRVKLDQHTYTATTKAYVLASLNRLLTAFMKGR